MRAAGDSSYYRLSLVNQGGKPVGREVLIPSVTSILDAVPPPASAMGWWGYRMGLEEARKLAKVEVGSSPIFNDELDDDAFYEEIKRLGREGQVVTPQNTLEKAGDRGTTVHDLAEYLFKNGEMPDKDTVPEELQGYGEALWRWHKARIVPLQKAGIEVILLEQPLFSLRYFYAGTCDLILKDSTGMYHVIDFKTAKGIYESALLQVAAYAYAAVEQGYIPEGALTNRLVVRLGKDGKYATKTSECSIEDFVKVYDVWKWLQSMNGGRKR